MAREKTTSLQRTRTLMSISRMTRRFSAVTIPFDCHMPDDDPDDEVQEHQFFLDRGVWEDMGKPETITVTVEKGDKLNG